MAAAVLAAGVALTSCDGSTGAPVVSSPTAPSNPGTGGSPPTLSGTLRSGCFGWPATDFSPANKADLATLLAPGDRAVEFALRDLSGNTVRLSGLLATRPVLLITGSFT